MALRVDSGVRVGSVTLPLDVSTALMLEALLILVELALHCVGNVWEALGFVTSLCRDSTSLQDFQRDSKPPAPPSFAKRIRRICFSKERKHGDHHHARDVNLGWAV